MARDDVAQADDVAVNDLSYDDVSLNKRENKNIILIILHVLFLSKNDNVTLDDVSPSDTLWYNMSSDDMLFIGLWNMKL